MGWLSGWKKRIKLTIDKNDIDAALSHFPVLVYLSSSSGRNAKDVTAVFDEVGANRKRIAVTKDDGTTQLYVEIEKWDSVNEKAWLHVSRSGWSISNTADTDIYLYYDNSQSDNTTYVGDPSDAVVHNVWDASHKLVTHMRDDPDTSHVRDSTVNANDGTKKGAGEPAVTTAGKIDDAQDFDGTDDVVNCGDVVTLGQNMTLALWVKDIPDADLYHEMLTKGEGTTMNYNLYIIRNGHATVPRKASFIFHDGTTYRQAISTTDIMGATGWFFIVGTYDGSVMRIYVNGVEEDTLSGTWTPVTTTERLGIGARDNGGVWEHFTDGIIDEVRISDTARSAAWIKASYESGRDDLISYGSQEIFEALTDALNLADVLRTQETYYRSLADNFSLADAITVLRARIVGLLDGYSLADVIATQLVPPFKTISLTDAFALADVLARQETYYRSLLDGYSLTDAVSAQEVYYRVLVEGYALADAAAAIRTRRLLVTDALTLADIIATIRGRRLLVADHYTLIDIASTQETYYRTLTDAYTLADIASTLRSRRLTLADAHDFADVLATQETYYRTLLDAHSLADVVSTQEIYHRALTDAYALADIFGTQEAYYRTLADGYSLADTIARQEVHRRFFADGHALADLTSFQEAYYRTITDAYDLADIVSTLRSRRLALVDGHLLADALSTQEALYRTLVDAFGLADALSTKAVIALAIADAYALADITSIRRNPILLARLISKLIQLIDLQGR